MMDPKLTMEVPPQVREFAEKSVDQADSKRFSSARWPPCSSGSLYKSGNIDVTPTPHA
jgi:hypothetical protein